MEGVETVTIFGWRLMKKKIKCFKVVRQDPKKNDGLLKLQASQIGSYIDYYDLFKKLEK